MALRELFLAVLVLGVATENTRLKEVFSWKTVEYTFPKSSDRAEAIKSKSFIPENNLPLGLDVWRDKLFVTVPRWKSGVVSSLNYIDISGIDTSLETEIDENPTPLIEIEPEVEEEDEEGPPGNEEEDGPPDDDEEEEPTDDGEEEDLPGDEEEVEGASDGGGGGDDDDGLLDGIGGLLTGEDGVLDTVGDLTSPLIGGDSNESGVLDGVLGTVGDLTEPVTDLVGGVGDLLPDEPLNTVGDLAAPVTDLVGDVTDALPGPVGDLVGGLTGPVEGILGNDDDDGDEAASATDASDADNGDGGPLDAVGDLAAPVTDLVGDVTDALPGPVGDLVGGLTGPVEGLLGNNDDDGDDAASATDASDADNGDGGPLDAVGDLAAPVTDLLGDVTDVLPGPVGDLVGGLTGPVEGLLGIDDDDGDEDVDTPTEGDIPAVDVEEQSAIDSIPEGAEGTEESESDEESDESRDETDEDDSIGEGQSKQFMTRAFSPQPYKSLGSKKYAGVEESANKKCSEKDQICKNPLKRKSKSKKSKEAARLKTPKKQGNKAEKTGKANTNKTEKKSKTSKSSQKKTNKSKGEKNEGFQGNVSEKPQKNSKGKEATSSKTKKTSKKKNDTDKTKNSNKARDSRKKKEKKVSKKDKMQDSTCRDFADNPCGIPKQEPIYAEVLLKPPKPLKSEEGKKSKKKKKKNCKKKCRKPKKEKKELQHQPQETEGVKPAKVSATSPALIPYPDIETNTPTKDSKDTKITSVFRVRVDACDRLWAMDTGIADILGNTVVYSSPQILIYDLLTDKLVRKYEFKSEENQESSFFANIIVDASKSKCGDAFAYVPDLGSYAIVVYDFKNDKAWRIKHNFFHFNPLEGNYNVGGVNFQWTDGIFSLALTRPNPDGSKTAYFHALSSYSQFKVNTFILQNEDEAKSSNYSAYTLVGNKGPDSQTSADFIHEPTGVMFYTQVNKNAVYCWNTDKPFKSENLEEVASDSKTMIFPNDLKVDYKNNLWVLTDKLPVFVKQGLTDSDVNYRIFVSPVSEAIKNTNCAP